MRIIIDTVELRRLGKWKIMQLLEKVDPYRKLPEVFVCSCGFTSPGGVWVCRGCGAGNPRFEEYEYLIHPDWRTQINGDESWEIRFEKKWAKTQRQIDNAKTRDHKAGIHIGNRPRGRRS